VKRVRYATRFTSLFFTLQPATHLLWPGLPATTLLAVLHHAPSSPCPPQHPTALTSTTIWCHLNWSPRALLPPPSLARLAALLVCTISVVVTHRHDWCRHAPSHPPLLTLSDFLCPHPMQSTPPDCHHCSSTSNTPFLATVDPAPPPVPMQDTPLPSSLLDASCRGRCLPSPCC
jgi:hypothetical protein